MVRKSKDVLKALLDHGCSVAHLFPSNPRTPFEAKYSLLYELKEFRTLVAPCPLFNLAAQEGSLEVLDLLLGNDNLPIHIRTESPFDFCVFSKPIVEAGTQVPLNLP